MRRIVYSKRVVLAEVPGDNFNQDRDGEKDVGPAAVTYRLNIFRWPGRHQWSITGGQRAGGHPGRQVLAKLRLRSNIRVITRYYTEHVDGLAEAGSPTTTNIATSSFFCFTTITSFIVHLRLLRLRRLSPSCSRLLYRGLSSSSSSPASVNLSVSLLHLPAAFTRSLLGHDRECGVLVSLPPPPSSPPPPLPVGCLFLSLSSVCGFCTRFAIIAWLGLTRLKKFSGAIMQFVIEVK